ncbi:MAG: hypothetical protein GYA30_01265 [Chloroflexi bacterium]|nr:hypothetical protein [Chloroflexota bacterium]
MGNCDMCNRPVNEATAARFSPAQVQAAARAGYRPAAALDSTLWQGLGLSPDEARQQAEAAWLNLVQKSPTDWVLCDICAAQFRPYLPGSMKAAVPVAGEMRSPAPSRPAPAAPPIPLARQEWLQKRWWLLLGAAFLLLALARGVINWATARAMTLPAPALVQTLSTTATFVEAPVFSGDGRLLAIANAFQQEMDLEWHMEVWNVATGQPIYNLTPGTNGVDYLALSQDGQLLAVGGVGDQVELWDLSTGEQRLGLNLPGLTFQKNRVFGLALSPNGQWLASAGVGTVFFWETETGAQVKSLPLDCNALSFSPDSRWLACQSLLRPTLILWDVTQDQAGPTLDCGTFVQIAPRFSPDGQRLAAFGGSADGTVSRLCQWQVANWHPLPAPALDDLRSVAALGFSPDSRYELVLGTTSEQPYGTSTLWLWDLTEDKERGSRSGLQSSSGIFSPDGKTLVLFDSADASTGFSVLDLTPLLP